MGPSLPQMETFPSGPEPGSPAARFTQSGCRHPSGPPPPLWVQETHRDMLTHTRVRAHTAHAHTHTHTCTRADRTHAFTHVCKLYCTYKTHSNIHTCTHYIMSTLVHTHWYMCTPGHRACIHMLVYTQVLAHVRTQTATYTHAHTIPI